MARFRDRQPYFGTRFTLFAEEPPADTNAAYGGRGVPDAARWGPNAALLARWARGRRLHWLREGRVGNAGRGWRAAWRQ